MRGEVSALFLSQEDYSVALPLSDQSSIFVLFEIPDTKIEVTTSSSAYAEVPFLRKTQK